MPRIEMNLEGEQEGSEEHVKNREVCGKRVHLNSGQHLALATGMAFHSQRSVCGRREIRPTEEDQDVCRQQQT